MDRGDAARMACAPHLMRSSARRRALRQRRRDQVAGAWTSEPARSTPRLRGCAGERGRGRAHCNSTVSSSTSTRSPVAAISESAFERGLPLLVAPAIRSFVAHGANEKARLRAGHHPVDNVPLQRNHADGALAQREGRPRRCRRQDALEAFARFGNSADSSGWPRWTSAPTWAATRRMIRSPSARQFHAHRRAPTGKPIHPKGAIRIQHHLHHVRVRARRRSRPHRRAQHLDAAVERRGAHGLRNRAHDARLRFGNCRRVIHPHWVGVFLHHIAHQAAPTQQVAAQLLHELLEPRLALGTRRVLVRLGNWRVDREE